MFYVSCTTYFIQQLLFHVTIQQKILLRLRICFTPGFIAAGMKTIIYLLERKILLPHLRELMI